MRKAIQGKIQELMIQDSLFPTIHDKGRSQQAPSLDSLIDKELHMSTEFRNTLQNYIIRFLTNLDSLIKSYPEQIRILPDRTGKTIELYSEQGPSGERRLIKIKLPGETIIPGAYSLTNISGGFPTYFHQGIKEARLSSHGSPVLTKLYKPVFEFNERYDNLEAKITGLETSPRKQAYSRMLNNAREFIQFCCSAQRTWIKVGPGNNQERWKIQSQSKNFEIHRIYDRQSQLAQYELIQRHRYIDQAKVCSLAVLVKESETEPEIICIKRSSRTSPEDTVLLLNKNYQSLEPEPNENTVFKLKGNKDFPVLDS